MLNACDIDLTHSGNHDYEIQPTLPKVSNPSLFQLIYTSASKSSLDTPRLEELAKRSAIKNRQLDITGLLLSYNGTIMQILEGEEPNVTTLYTEIENDSRHSSCMVLLRRDIKQREFADWSMGYKNVAQSPQLIPCFNLTLPALAQSLPKMPSFELMSLINSYSRVTALMD